MRSAFVVSVMSAVAWWTIWFTPDQYGQMLFRKGEFVAAAQTFQDPMWQGLAWFRAGEFEQAMQAYGRVATPEAEFNRGNCLVMRGKYSDAVERYQRALELRPNWQEAIENRDLAEARAKMLEMQGGDMGDQEIGADEIRFDKKKPGGQDTAMTEEAAMGDRAIQALWLRRVQTNPADFLRAKFAYQRAISEEGEAEE